MASAKTRRMAGQTTIIPRQGKPVPSYPIAHPFRLIPVRKAGSRPSQEPGSDLRAQRLFHGADQLVRRAADDLDGLRIAEDFDLEGHQFRGVERLAALGLFDEVIDARLGL